MSLRSGAFSETNVFANVYTNGDACGMKTKLKTFPSLKSDEQAEDFVDRVDLSEYDLKGFKPIRFEIEPKSAAPQAFSNN